MLLFTTPRLLFFSR